MDNVKEKMSGQTEERQLQQSSSNNAHKEEKRGQTEERQLQQSSSNNAHKEEKRKVSRTWEAAMRLKGSIEVYDPKFLL